MGRLSVWGSPGPTWTGARAPALMGAGWRPGAMSALRSRSGPVPLASRDPQGRGHAHRPRTCPGWCVCWGVWGERCGVAGSWELGVGSRARARAPLSPAATASPSLGGRSAGRYLLSPGRAPSRLPARPGPPWRRAAPALSSAAPASELGPESDPPPLPLPGRPPPLPDSHPPTQMPPPRAAPSPMSLLELPLPGPSCGSAFLKGHCIRKGCLSDLSSS